MDLIKNPLSNINININNMQDYLKNLAKEKKNTANQSKKKINYFKYNIDKILKTDFHELKNKDVLNVNVCCFKIVESTKYSEVLYPYLEYLLFKYPESKKKESNLCLLPFFSIQKKKNILNESKEFIKSIFNKQYNCLGYLVEENDVFLFYQIDVENNPNRIVLSKKSKFWWALLDEICNHKKILNFPIHSNTTNLFLKNPDLIYLKTKKNKNIENPIVAYKGDYFDFLPYLYIIGQKSESTTFAGPFYYFQNYLGSFRRGGWSSNYKMVKVKHKMITDENGKYKKGGIIRYAVFLNKTRVILNNDNDKLKKSLIEDIVRKNIRNQNTYIGKWSKHYDSLFLNKIKIDSESYYNLHPFIIIKNLENIKPLTIHEIDMKSLKVNWDPLYTKYDIL